MESRSRDGDYFSAYEEFDSEYEQCSCGREIAGECQQCGDPLCFMCLECGAGFCNAHPDESYRPEGPP